MAIGLFVLFLGTMTVHPAAAQDPVRPAASPALRSAMAAIQAEQYPQAIASLHRAAGAGEAAAMTELGLLHYFGKGLAEDDDEAYRWFEKAARLEDPPAMFWLGRMNLLGHGPARKNPDADRDAARWLFESARRGQAEAQYYLGLLFMAGTGVMRDETEALKWIARAAGAGHAPAKAFMAGR